jgi:hypothetical protein
LLLCNSAALVHKTSRSSDSIFPVVHARSISIRANFALRVKCWTAPVSNRTKGVSSPVQTGV